MYGLSKSQRDVLDFITAYIAQNNFSPSYEEIKVGTGRKSKSDIARLVNELCERGYIVRLKHKQRAIGVIRAHPGTTESP